MILRPQRFAVLNSLALTQAKQTSFQTLGLSAFFAASKAAGNYLSLTNVEANFGLFPLCL